jgi:hypothetical protein
MSTKNKERDHWSDFLIEWAPKINYHAQNAARQYGVDPEELVSEVGKTALEHAVHTYDPNNISERTQKPTQFKTHAENTLKYMMNEHAKKLKGGVSQSTLEEAKAFKNPEEVPPVKIIDPKGYIPQPPKS